MNKPIDTILFPSRFYELNNLNFLSYAEITQTSYSCSKPVLKTLLQHHLQKFSIKDASFTSYG